MNKDSSRKERKGGHFNVNITRAPMHQCQFIQLETEKCPATVLMAKRVGDDEVQLVMM